MIPIRSGNRMWKLWMDQPRATNTRGVTPRDPWWPSSDVVNPLITNPTILLPNPIIISINPEGIRQGC